MAISFVGTSGHRVSHGSGTSLDDLAQFTYALVIYPKATDQSAGLIAKGTGATGSRRSFEFRDSVTNTAVFCLVDGSTEDSTSESTAAVYAANNWYFMAATFSGMGSPPKMFVSLLSDNTVAEVSYTAGSTNGSGTLATNNTLDQYVGAYGAGTSGNPNANIAWVGIWNDDLTLAELQAQRKNLSFPIRKANNVLFCHYGIHGAAGLGAQADWSGNNNHGTNTSGTYVGHPNLTILNRNVFMPYAVAATPSTRKLRHLSLLGVG
jgi:hypothetical protein